jgi:hypothetical protein
MAINLSMGANEKDSPPQKVRIKPTETGALITTFMDNTTYGYVTLNSEELNANGEVIHHSLRTALLGAKVQLLKYLVDYFSKEDQLPGRIVVKEFLESQVPEKYMSRLNKNLSYEDSIVPFLKGTGKSNADYPITPYEKRVGKDGVELTLGGECILRFSDFVVSGNVKDELIPNELFNTLTATQGMEQIFADTRFKLPTYEDVSPFSKRTRPTQIIQDKSPTAFTEKTNQSVEEKKTPKEQSPFEKSFGTILISIILVAYVGYIIIDNDRISRMEGSSLWEQLMLLFVAIGVYAIYKAFKK